MASVGELRLKCRGQSTFSRTSCLGLRCISKQSPQIHATCLARRNGLWQRVVAGNGVFNETIFGGGHCLGGRQFCNGCRRCREQCVSRLQDDRQYRLVHRTLPGLQPEICCDGDDRRADRRCSESLHADCRRRLFQGISFSRWGMDGTTQVADERRQVRCVLQIAAIGQFQEKCAAVFLELPKAKSQGDFYASGRKRTALQPPQAEALSSSIAKASCSSI